MFRGVFVAVVVAAVVASTGSVAAADNEPPLPEAGLDQEVDQGQVVYLDAGGSVDPDGEIVRIEWTITAPDGSAVTPNCRTCEQTYFRANQSGTYAVTVAVTDDDGATREDTLYVTATAGEPPTVSVSGPQTASVDSAVTLEASVIAGAAPLERVTWYNGERELATETADGRDATVTLTETFTRPGTKEIRAVVTDEYDVKSSDAHTLAVSGSDSGGPPTFAGPTGSSDSTNTPTPALYRDQRNGVARLKLNDDGTVTRGNEVILTEDQVEALKNKEGVSIVTSEEGWVGENKQIVVDNENIQQDINDDAAQLGKGFGNNELFEFRPEKYDTNIDSSDTSTDNSDSGTDTSTTSDTTDTTDTTDSSSDSVVGSSSSTTDDYSSWVGNLGDSQTGSTDSTNDDTNTDDSTNDISDGGWGDAFTGSGIDTDVGGSDSTSDFSDSTNDTTSEFSSDDCTGLGCAFF